MFFVFFFPRTRFFVRFVFGVFSLVYFELSALSISASDCMERLVSKMTCYVSSGT